MAAAARQQKSPRDGRPIHAGARGKVEQPHPGRLRRHPPRAIGGRRGTTARRPPRRSPLVAHPRPATANAEPGTGNGQRRRTDEAENHAVARPAANQATLGAASRARPEPLRTSASQRRRCISERDVAETPLETSNKAALRRWAPRRAVPLSPDSLCGALLGMTASHLSQ